MVGGRRLYVFVAQVSIHAVERGKKLANLIGWVTFKAKRIVGKATVMPVIKSTWL